MVKLLFLLLAVPLLSFSDAVILIYHRFGEDRYPSTSVSLEDFRKQMEFLKEEGYRVIPLSELVEMIKERRNIPEKTVVITIDDAYRSTMKAFEIIKEYGFPFTLFLYLEAVGRYPDFLTLEDLKKLKDYGVEFGNHSYSHKNFAYTSEEEFLEDLKKSEEEFIKLFGERPRFYALPYGFYNRRVIEILRERGYEAVLTQDPSPVNSHSDLFLLPRQPVVGSWSKFEEFKRRLRYEYLPVEARFPDYGFLKENPPETAGAKLKFPQKYGNCRVYISELGWLETYRSNGIVLARDVPELKRKWNRVGVMCKNKDTGRRAFSFWLILSAKATTSPQR